MNNPSQGLAAHITKLAAADLFDKIVEEGDIWNVRLSLILHDEFQLETKLGYEEKYKVILENIMVNSGNSLLPNKTVTLSAEAKIGSSWFDTK